MRPQSPFIASRPAIRVLPVVRRAIELLRSAVAAAEKGIFNDLEK
jgi:hypothetical protein